MTFTNSKHIARENRISKSETAEWIVSWVENAGIMWRGSPYPGDQLAQKFYLESNALKCARHKELKGYQNIRIQQIEVVK